MNANHGFRRIAAVGVILRPADVDGNVAALTAAAATAQSREADVAVYPELAVTGYTCADLFHQERLIAAAETGLARFAAVTRDASTLHVLGLPVRAGGLLFNAAVVVQRGRLLGVVPKTYLPNTREFYEPRWFAAASLARGDNVTLAGATVPFGTDLVFACADDATFRVGVELCEDLWSPTPPSTVAALNGATVLCNLSASNELVGKADYRRALVLQQSARCLGVYAYAGAGPGESSTDLVFGGHRLIAENGRLLAEDARFVFEGGCLCADADLAWMTAERRQTSAFGQAATTAPRARHIPFAAPCPAPPATLLRHIDPYPFVPSDAARRDERCAEVFAIQSTGLATRLRHAGLQRVVLGLSGGLDSTLALLVCLESFRRLDLPCEGLRPITMPGPGTSARTLRNVRDLCHALGLALETVDIADASRRHLADLGHDGATRDIAFENVQARIRTQFLMNRANMLGALVVGTGDLSELALGWCTYNGDHMSMYGVNSGVPKTLVRHLVDWFAARHAAPTAAGVLRDIGDTPISPELLPPDAHGAIAQHTEELVGPYALHDFFLYHFARYGAPPAKLLYLARQAFGDTWPEDAQRRWLGIFLRRFFAQQFKRSCLPDGPKVGTLNLSPRGDWRMPSDAAAATWLEDL